MNLLVRPRGAMQCCWSRVVNINAGVLEDLSNALPRDPRASLIQDDLVHASGRVLYEDDLGIDDFEKELYLALGEYLEFWLRRCLGE